MFDLASSKLYFDIEKRKYNDSLYSSFSSSSFHDILSNKKQIFGKINSLLPNPVPWKDFSSEHYEFFNCLASSTHNFSNILEIGTFKGFTSAYLAFLFPGASISTIDLPSTSPEYVNTYGRINQASEFAQSRDLFLQNFKNIQSFCIPSTSFLFDCRQKFDLIWIDGDHSYPQVCIDIVLSLNLLADGGFVMVDDIYRFGDELPENYRKSVAAYETIENLFTENIVVRDYIFKRPALKELPNGEFAYPEVWSKSIAILRKSQYPLSLLKS